jgi:hypothetical protein
MLVVDWATWLDQHIPYYEAQRLGTLYQRDPPAEVLCISAAQRLNRTHEILGQRGRAWEYTDGFINGRGFRVEPIFLERDTHGQWYWAFWQKGAGLMVVLGLP